MPGETDLTTMLTSLGVDRRPGRWALVSSAAGDVEPLRSSAAAMIEEREGTTLVVPADEARAAGFAPDFEGAWLALTVHSSLDAVGLTAACSVALGAEGISCNMFAGYFHDHILVPVDRVDDAISTLSSGRVRNPLDY